MNFFRDIGRNIDKRIVTSVVVGMGIFGAGVWAVKKSGIKVAKDAAVVAQGGK